MKYWWVNQKKTHKQEIPGGFLWSPKIKANGARNQFWDNMTLMELGDVVFSYYFGEIKAVGVVTEPAQTAMKPDFGKVGDNWSSEGWYEKVELKSLAEVVAKLNQAQWPIIEGPILRTGATQKINSIYVRDPDQNLIEISELVDVSK